MNLMYLKKSLNEGIVNSIYIFCGDEYAVLETYIDKVCSMFNTRISCDSVSEMYRNIASRSFFNQGSSVYVIRYDKDFLANESLWEDLESKLKRRGITLVLKYQSIDSRSKFYKRFEKYITVFDILSDSVIKKYMKNSLSLSDKNMDFLYKSCCGVYGRILLEMDKIKNVSEFFNIGNDEALNRCIESNAIYIEVDGKVFELVESILNRNYKDVYRKLYESKRRGDSQLGILSILHSNVKSLLQVKLCDAKSNKDISNITGLSNYQISSSFKYTDKYSCKELIKIMKYIKYCDESVKNGNLTEDNVIDYLLVNIL